MDKDKEDRQDIQPELADPENLQDLQVEQKKEAAEAQPLGEEKAPEAQPEEEDLKEKDDVLSIQYDEDNDEKGTKKEKALRRRPFLIGLCAVVAVCIGVCVYLLASQGVAEPDIVLVDNGKVYPGVSMEGVQLGNLSPAEAQASLEQAVAARNEELSITLVFSDREEILPAETIGINADAQTAMKNAMLVGRSGSIQQRKADIQEAAQSGKSIEIGYHFDEEEVRQKVREYAKTIPAEPTEEEVTFRPDLPERFLFSDRKDGVILDEEEFVERVMAEVTNHTFGRVEVPGTPVEATGEKTQTRENTVLIAKFSTSFAKGSNAGANRVHNIKVATEKLNGTIVQPGETASVNEIIGPRTSSKIWRAAPAINDGVSVNELGGGVCQVSSTLFNAVARADLEIVEWVHHSWPSNYVDIGCDATISTGGPDFKFKNNTEWPIYIVGITDTEKKTVTFEIWGRPLPNGQTIDIVGVRTATVPHPTTPIYTTDPEKVRKGRDGQRSQTYKVYKDANGKEIKRVLIHSNYYRALAPRVLKTSEPSSAPVVNPTTRPTATPTPKPSATPTPAATPAPTPAATAAQTSAAGE